MSDRIALTIEITLDQQQQIETLAHQQGYTQMSDYLLALVEQDAAANEEQAQLIEDLRVSIHEVLTGQTIPASEMWKILESEYE